MPMLESEIKVVDAMAQYGGSFVKALAECFYRADDANFVKLKEAFPEYWKFYSEMAERIERQENPWGNNP